MVDLVFTRFQGRLDVYARRYEKKNGESGYSPQCFNFWKDFCPKKQRMKIVCTDKWIYLGKDHLSGYIKIPRGLYDKLLDNLNSSDIPYEISDDRQSGKQIHVSFNGELREEQKPALSEMIRHENGILHAATAFGKTVVCSAIIAEKKVKCDAMRKILGRGMKDEKDNSITAGSFDAACSRM